MTGSHAIPSIGNILFGGGERLAYGRYN